MAFDTKKPRMSSTQPAHTTAALQALLGREFTRHPALVQTYDYGLRPVDPIDPADPPTVSGCAGSACA